MDVAASGIEYECLHEAELRHDDEYGNWKFVSFDSAEAVPAVDLSDEEEGA